MLRIIYFCNRKQGEKIGCYRLIGTSIFGVQGGSDATLFFFYVIENALHYCFFGVIGYNLEAGFQIHFQIDGLVGFGSSCICYSTEACFSAFLIALLMKSLIVVPDEDAASATREWSSDDILRFSFPL